MQSMWTLSQNVYRKSSSVACRKMHPQSLWHALEVYLLLSRLPCDTICMYVYV
jgi:hypothetical protein